MYRLVILYKDRPSKTYRHPSIESLAIMAGVIGYNDAIRNIEMFLIMKGRNVLNTISPTGVRTNDEMNWETATYKVEKTQT